MGHLSRGVNDFICPDEHEGLAFPEYVFGSLLPGSPKDPPFAHTAHNVSNIPGCQCLLLHAFAHICRG